MAMMGSSTWNGQDPGVHPGPDDDFQQFLDMNGMGNLGDGLQFDFAEFHNANGGQMIPAQRDGVDTPMSGTDAPGIPSRQEAALHGQVHPVSTATSHPSIPAGMVPPPTPTEAISEIDAQIQYLQQQRMQQQQRQLEEQQVAFFTRQSRMVPPTPQSLELQAGAQYFSPTDQQSQQHAVFVQYQRLKEQQDMSFTPLVSPAVTPLETQFPVETQFTVPGAYFSPLTSPALHAQNESNHMFDQRLTSGNSPQDMELELLPAAGPASADLAKKARKNNASKARKGSVRQSPISKPISKPSRKKTSTTPVMSAQVLDQLAESHEPRQPRQQQPSHSSSRAPTSSAGGTTDTENESVSPETLTDMPPPPVPKSRSARPSPFIQPQTNTATPNLGPIPGKPSPATPASLMKLASPKSNHSNTTVTQESATGEGIETFELPESLNVDFQKPPISPLITQSKSTTVSPFLEPNSTQSTGFQPLPSPVFAKPTTTISTMQSPQLTPGSSGPSARRTPQMLPRSSKKRSSTSSVHVSPALRPKISPNIKPLLPGGGATAEDQASRLLASKSNYQNILEGNTVPGVSYPSELSTNLTSKRTSHKIAEQGRRNRINSALQEIATLLPPAAAAAVAVAEAGDGDGDRRDKNGGGANAPNSKASTVEMAIEYIKQLKQEVAEATERAEAAERKLEMQVTP